MNKIGIIAAAVACISSPAFAQDSSDTEKWDGFYAGVHAGGSWMSGDMTGFTPFNSYQGFPVTDAKDSSEAGGVQVGYNHQMGTIGLGAEASFTINNLRKETDSSTPGTLFWRDTEFNASIGPRVTVATPSFALYGKGGLAIGKFEVGHNQNGNLISNERTLYGYMLGVGADYAIGSNLSIGVQYEYQDFGDGEIFVPSPNGSEIFIAPNAALHHLKAVVNYRF
ncbi:MAG: outer membrane beta-barrel protein [Erythrobacter sp.]|jgi:outer membrane immunogenic protein|uniref:outer membrane protein n=1 Tax=Erythrobacter sp. TaxID=1042 RepID=UPI002B489FA0|nr:outer membrane beta-barrel protein [Erythrobacter sp.]WRH70491.1 MAG: outer membrane beta-barrel protein [Erythrobacter sp.]